MKFHILLFLLILLLSSVSCTYRKNEDKKFVIGFSQCTSDPWRNAVLLEMQIEISNYKNVELIVYNASDNSSRQISQIRKLISQNVDILIISPNEVVPVTDVAVEAYRKGIPTIIHDRKIQSEEYTISIGANNFKIGAAIGRYINSILPPQSTILEIWGLEGSSPAIERHEGFLSTLNKENSYHREQVYGKWHYNIAQEEIKKIKSYSSIDLIYAHNDAMALAARDAIMQRDSVAGKRIKFIGIDGVYGDGAGLEAVAEEKLEASFQYPTGGAIAIQVAMDILNGEKVEKNHNLNTSIIDRSNARTILAQSEQVNSYQQRINKQKAEEENLLSRFYFLRNSTILILILLGVIVPLLSYVLYINLKIKNKNRELNDKNLLVESQKEELSIKNKQIENVSTQKLRFFTNVSHEIRTPLTLITGPVNKLLKSEKMDPSLQEEVALIKRNTDRLYRIVNQILDFRRIDNDAMKLIVRKTDIVSLVKEVFDYFTGMAVEKQIKYEFFSDIKEQYLYMDVDKIEQVLVNIISNAFKFSNKKGTVNISVSDEKESVSIIVEDNGKGLNKEDLNHLFERFYTGNKNGGVAGFGIGLNLSKEYIDMHNGIISAESQSGEYTLFRIQLFKGVDHINKEYIINETYPTIPNLYHVAIDTFLIDEILSKYYDDCILIVEDDPDVRTYLKKELSSNFQVLTAEDGREALKVLNETDEIKLVISDVLMPEVNGFQLCNKIKNDITISHIPIILLTALSEDSQRIYGIAEGADEYIQKPFDIRFLKIRAFNIIQERIRMKESFTKHLQSGFTDNSEIDQVVHVDDLFSHKLFSVLESSYEDSDFNVEELSERIGLSRVHLYRKTKALFDLSPTDFLRNYRLNKSLMLLKQKRYAISEIAYMGGFTSPAYFTKCFKTLYGQTPTEYVAKIKSTDVTLSL